MPACRQLRSKAQLVSNPAHKPPPQPLPLTAHEHTYTSVHMDTYTCTQCAFILKCTRRHPHVHTVTNMPGPRASLETDVPSPGRDGTLAL